MSNLTFSIYVDSEPLFCGTAIDALIQIYALYWIFNIEYPSVAKIAFTFIAAVLLRKKVSRHTRALLDIDSCTDMLPTPF